MVALLTCCVDPLAIHVYRRSKVCHAGQLSCSFPLGHELAAILTVDSALELLPTDFALERADTSFLVELDRDRVLVVAEEACEECRQRIALGGLVSLGQSALSSDKERNVGRDCTLFGPWGLLELLRLPIFCLWTLRSMDGFDGGPVKNLDCGDCWNSVLCLFGQLWGGRWNRRGPARFDVCCRGFEYV